MENLKPSANLRYDVPAAIVVFLVALPLCLGVALASGVPLFSGIIAGAVGGIVLGVLSKSPLSVSGPAAGLTVIVLNAVQTLPTLESFLLAVVLAGMFQLLLGMTGAGVIGDFIPSSVIKGMLAAIGVILILKQIPHAVGYDKDYEGDFSFNQNDGENTISELWHLLNEHITLGALVIASVSIAFLWWWDHTTLRRNAILKLLPGPLFVVMFGVLANLLFQSYVPLLAIEPEHLVKIPVAENASAFFGQFRFPDWSQIGSPAVWTVAITLALVASIETLLSIEAIDKLDPFKRITPTEHELRMQGIGNMVSGLIGGMPITSVIVRSSANVASGGRTQAATFLHGVILFTCAAFIPHLLNYIPLSALAAILISVGFKLTKPKIFLEEYKKGWTHLIPFVVTILAILLTDLLIGIAIGLVVGTFFVMRENYKSALTVMADDNDNHLIRFKKDLSFIHKYELRKVFAGLPNNCKVLLDLSRIGFVDLDNAEIINDFISSAQFRDIKVEVKITEGQLIQKHLNLNQAV
jgi:carbonic anhydrase